MTNLPDGSFTWAVILLSFCLGALLQRVVLQAKIKFYRKELRDLSGELMRQNSRELGL